MIGVEDFDALYQTYYPDDQMPYLLPDALPLINFLLGGSTDTSVSGKLIDYPWMYGAPAGYSQTYSTAAAQAGNAPQAVHPQIRLSQAYKNMGFLDKDIVLSDGEASYGDLMEVTVGGARMDFMSKTDQLLQGNGSGNVASFTFASATPTILVLNITPTVLTGDTNQPVGTAIAETMFEIRDSIVITSTNPSDGTPPTVVAGPFNITRVGDDGTLTIDSAAGLTDTNVYGIAGAGNTMGFNSALVFPSLVGVGAMNPYGGPLVNDSFLNVNRYPYAKRLAGTWQDCSTKFTLEGAIKRSATLMRNTGVSPGGVWASVDPFTYDALDTKLQTQQRYSQQQLGVFFFDSLAVNTAMGRVNVVCNPHQSQGFIRLYAPGAAQLMYRDGFPHFAKLSNGTDEQFGSNYDGREKRLRAYMQLRSKDPRRMSVVKVNAATT